MDDFVYSEFSSDIPEVRSKNIICVICKMDMIQSLGGLARGVRKWLGTGRVPNTSLSLPQLLKRKPLDHPSAYSAYSTYSYSYPYFSS